MIMLKPLLYKLTLVASLLLLSLVFSSSLMANGKRHFKHFSPYGFSHYNHYGGRFFGHRGFGSSRFFHHRKSFNHFYYPSFSHRIGFYDHPGYRRIEKPYTKMKFDGKRYYYSHGSYFRRRSGLYFPVEAPIGATIEELPEKSIKIINAGEEYHYAYDTLYKLDAESGLYIVTSYPDDLTIVLDDLHDHEQSSQVQDENEL